jgi:hypothetical protein
VKKYGKYRRNCEMIWTIWKKIVKRHGHYSRNPNSIEKRNGKYRRKVS